MNIKNYISYFFYDSPSPTVITDLNGGVLAYNNAFRELFHFEEGNTSPRGNSFDLIISELTESGLINKILKEDKYQNAEVIRLLPDGSLIYLSVTGYLVMQNNIREGLCFTFTDITERKKIEEQNLLKTKILEHIGQSVIAINLEGEVIYWNGAAERLYGWSSDEVLGKKILDLTPTSFTPEQGLEILKKLLNGQEWRGEFEIRGKDGSYFPVAVTDSPIFDNNNNIIGIVGISEDITLRKKAERESSEARQKAEEMNTLKSNFLANMSHELRTPMIGILGFAELLYNELENGDTRNKVKLIFESGKRLLDTMNMILNLSSLETDPQKVTPKIVDISKIIYSIANSFSFQVQEKNIKLEIKIVKDLIATMDEYLYTQVVRHLLNNAIKYTHEGTVTVIVSEEICCSQAYLKTSIIDTGIGISEEYRHIIFEPFRQVSEGFNRQYEGAGLGLTLAKKFVELMKGEISFASIQGKGTGFDVRIPLTNNEVICDSKLSKPFLQDQNKILINNLPSILLVETDCVTITIIKLFLGEKCHVDFARKGEEAIELASVNKYDAVLMDINLGGKFNSLETASLVRNLNDYSDVPIIALMTYAMVGEKDLYLTNGYSHFLFKPFTRKEITYILNQIIKYSSN